MRRFPSWALNRHKLSRYCVQPASWSIIPKPSTTAVAQRPPFCASPAQFSRRTRTSWLAAPYTAPTWSKRTVHACPPLEQDVEVERSPLRSSTILSVLTLVSLRLVQITLRLVRRGCSNAPLLTSFFPSKYLPPLRQISATFNDSSATNDAEVQFSKVGLVNHDAVMSATLGLASPGLSARVCRACMSSPAACVQEGIDE